MSKPNIIIQVSGIISADGTNIRVDFIKEVIIIDFSIMVGSTSTAISFKGSIIEFLIKKHDLNREKEFRLWIIELIILGVKHSSDFRKWPMFILKQNINKLHKTADSSDNFILLDMYGEELKQRVAHERPMEGDE